MSKFLQQSNDVYKFYKDIQAQKKYNDEIVNKTWHYQKKFGFQTSPRQGHEFWNNEADAFKHAFLAADLYFKYGDVGSTILGIGHEWQTNKNPQGEWNMDSWNNNQGREIAQEIQKEYGNNFMDFSPQKRDDIIAVKVMERMQRGQLITHPSDGRKYKRLPEYAINIIKKLQETTLPFTPTKNVGGVQNNGMPLGFATNIDINQLTQISSLQSSNMNIQTLANKNLFGYINPLTGNNRIFTREDIGAMTTDEFMKYEKEINAQLKAFNGTMPTNRDLQREAMTGGGVIYVNSYTRADGTKVKGYYRSKPKF